MHAQAHGGSRSMEDFRGDYEQLSTVIRGSWAENPSSPFFYSPSFLSSLFDYPESSFELAPAVYEGSELVAFVAGFPRNVLVAGVERRLLVIALLTVAADRKSRGYGLVVWGELIRRAREKRFDGVVNYCVVGDPMERMLEGACRRLDLPLQQLRPVSYRSRLLYGGTGAGSAADATAAARALTDRSPSVAQRVRLARTWSTEQAVWQTTREGAISAVGEGGVLTGYLQPVADPGLTRCLVIDDVLWDDAPDEERALLVRNLLANARAAGARIAILPDTGYADLGLFDDQGFKPSTQTIKAFLTLFSDGDPGDDAPSFYLDVF
jgi:hypothetical protein